MSYGQDKPLVQERTRDAPVAGVLERLERQVSEIEAMASVMEERFNAVLRPQLNDNSAKLHGGGTPVSVQSQLVMRIGEIEHRLSEARVRIGGVIDRCDL